VTRRIVFSLAILLSVLAVTVRAQGPIDPTTPPMASMRTLDQIEPRMLIDSVPYVIQKSGSYYLSRSLEQSVTNEPAIVVAVNDVVLDLNGFVIEGYAGGGVFYESGPAILQSNGLQNLTVKNGNIYNWNGQQDLGLGMVRLLGANNRIQNLTVRYCSRGIQTGPGSVIENCIVMDLDEGGFAQNFGFLVGRGSVVRDCVAQSIHGAPAYGFETGEDCVLERCTARSNITYTSTAGGFYLGVNAAAINCIASDNTDVGFTLSNSSRASGCSAQSSRKGFVLNEDAVAVDCMASLCSTTGFWVVEGGCLIERCIARNNGDGISAGYDGIVRDCVVADNDMQGINVRDSHNTIQGNVCNGNVSSGIFVFQDGNRIEDNQMCANDFGLYFRYWNVNSLAEKNVAVKNTARGNATQNYVVGISNSVAPIEGLGSFTNAWANFSL
jgi:parallel beta-helix repeat protein